MNKIVSSLFQLIKENIMISFSGGRTSAYMCWWLKTYMSHLYNLHFVYANTGLEHEKTLEFVDKVDKYLELNLTWIEAVISKDVGVGTSYTIVDYKTACRDNRLFKDLCSTYGLMNKSFPHCTRELKIVPIKKFAEDYFGKNNFRQALGIRADEPKRYTSKFNEFLQPLAQFTKTTKKDVLDFWKKQPFDLEIEEHYGNCVGCYKKSDNKLKMIADENPHYFDAFIELEKKYSHIKSKQEHYDNNEERLIYRHYRTACEVKHNLNLPKSLQEVDECAEECGSVDSNILLIVKEDMVYQKSLFDF